MAETILLQQRGRAVLVILNGELAAALHYRAAKELVRAAKQHLDAIATASGDEFPGAVTFRSGRFSVTVRHESAELVFIFDRHMLRLRGAEARAVWSGIAAQAALADEWDNASKVARDQAILTRGGEMRFALTDHPLIRQEAAGLARDDRDLRRYLPGGVKSSFMPGGLRLFHDTRPLLEQARETASKLPPGVLEKILASSSQEGAVR